MEQRHDAQGHVIGAQLVRGDDVRHRGDEVPLLNENLIASVANIISSYVVMMFATEAMRFSLSKGTFFGRLVVPLVCSTSPMSLDVERSSESSRLQARAPLRCRRPSSSRFASITVPPAGIALRAASTSPGGTSRNRAPTSSM